MDRSYKELPKDFASALVGIVARNRGGRGVSSLCRPEHWRETARNFAPLSRVSIVSGFFVPKAGAPETDGPGGAAVLARAFVRHGAEAEIWTDSLCRDAMRACAQSLGLPAKLVRAVDGSRFPAEFIPEGIVFSERLGRAADGGYYNISKVDISQWTAPLDSLAFLARASGIVTAGIGDGGNEVGMGNFLAELSALVPQYAACLSVVRTDSAVAVDVSNWGAYALAAALSLVWGEWHGVSEKDEKLMLEALIGTGAVDGITCRRGTSVDGFPLSVQRGVIADLSELYQKFAN